MGWNDRLRAVADRSVRAARGGLRRADGVLSGVERSVRAGTAQDQTVDGFIRDSMGAVARSVQARRSTTVEPSVTVLGFIQPGAIFGGIATLLHLAAAIARDSGRPLRFVQSGPHPQDVHLAEELRGLGIDPDPLRPSIVAARDAEIPIHPDDIVLVSAWWDARSAARLPLSKPFVYLVQDYEPIFYPQGDRSALAEMTYHLPNCVPVFNTSVLREYFHAAVDQHFADRGTHFEPAVLRAGGRRCSGRAQKTLFFYGRPGVERNLFHEGLRACDEASRSPAFRGWRFVTAGGSVPDLRLAGGQMLESVGFMGRSGYMGFMGEVDLALSPMLAPHPNYPTLEFAMSGARVVTTAWETKTDLSRYSSLIDVCDPTAVGLAEGLVTAAKAVNSGGAPAVRRTLPETWDEALDPVVDFLRDISW